MACPLCGHQHCVCRARTNAHGAASPTSQTEIRLADPEPWDDSEEPFESSLISSEQPDCYRSIALGPSERMPDLNAEEDSQLERLARRESRAQLDRDLSQQAEAWRDTLASKLEQYRSRRGKERLAGQFTMSLDFERSSHRAVLSATAPALQPEPTYERQPLEEVAPETVAPALGREIDLPGPAAPLATTVVPEHDPAPFDKPGVEAVGGVTSEEWVNDSVQEVTSPAPAEETPASAPPKKNRERKVIEFPRLLAFEPPAPSRDELAEPILDLPRIMDVPEETEQIELPLGGISLEPAHQDAAPTQGEIDVPLQVAAVAQRVFAGITDSVLILVATALFAGIVLNFVTGLPHTKLVLIVALIVPTLFWTVYHYLFLVHAATTPGMSVARLRLATFEGGATNRTVRRARAFAMLISCLSAGLGFMWALVDEDTLCWHDKISRTYLAKR